MIRGQGITIPSISNYRIWKEETQIRESVPGLGKPVRKKSALNGFTFYFHLFTVETDLPYGLIISTKIVHEFLKCSHPDEI